VSLIFPSPQRQQRSSNNHHKHPWWTTIIAVVEPLLSLSPADSPFSSFGPLWLYLPFSHHLLEQPYQCLPLYPYLPPLVVINVSHQDEISPHGFPSQLYLSIFNQNDNPLFYWKDVINYKQRRNLKPLFQDFPKMKNRRPHPLKRL
jgi:hypothetical protein